MFDWHLEQLAGKGIQILVMLLVSAAPLIIDVALALILIAWWIADMVIFVSNDRTDGNGCPLIASL